MHTTQKNLEIVTIAGNRPEIIKLSQLVRSLTDNYKHAFLYTGQHFSHNMKDVFSDELDIKFDYDLRSNTSDIDVLRENIRNFLQQVHASYVIVYGDTNSTLAGALASKDVGCKLIHIEAGLRCFDLARPEERNRIHIDSVADYLFAPTELNKIFLKYEDKEENQIFVTGNLIVDVCRRFSHALKSKSRNDPINKYVLLTLHRQSSVDHPETIRKLPSFLSQIKYKVIFPVHPRTKFNLIKYNIQLPQNVIMTDAVGYSDFLALLKNSIIVMTDSGGVQEEAIILRKPCITLSNTTERQETLLLKANRLFFPLDGNQQKNSICGVIEEMLDTKIVVNPYGENVTEKTLEVINNIINNGYEKLIQPL